jgi:hypothetical protein
MPSSSTSSPTRARWPARVRQHRQAAVTELAEVISILSEEQQRRVAALREARALLGTQGNYGALRAGAGELAALAGYILTGEATWADGDDDEDAEPE